MARNAIDAPVYTCAESDDVLKRILQEKLAEYNENNAGVTTDMSSIVLAACITITQTPQSL